MPRDYAKYKPKQARQKPAAQGWQQRLLFILIVLCLLGAALFGLYTYKNKAPDALHPSLTTWLTELHSRFSHHKSEIAAKSSIPQQTPQEPEVRFNFYTELPQMQVTLPETEETPPAAITKHALVSTQPASEQEKIISANQSQPTHEPSKPNNSAENKTQYVVQLGLFKNETAAGQTRVSLLLAGCEADTVAITDEATQTTLYRLQKGPYTTLSQAKTIMRQLQKKGIVGIIKQL